MRAVKRMKKNCPDTKHRLYRDSFFAYQSFPSKRFGRRMARRKMSYKFAAELSSFDKMGRKDVL